MELVPKICPQFSVTFWSRDAEKGCKIDSLMLFEYGTYLLAQVFLLMMIGMVLVELM
jgi:hypothetical protein